MKNQESTQLLKAKLLKQLEAVQKRKQVIDYLLEKTGAEYSADSEYLKDVNSGISFWRI